MNAIQRRFLNRLYTASFVILVAYLGALLFGTFGLGIVGGLVGFILAGLYYEEFFAAIGAAHIAYVECIKDKRTAICTECGELWDAEIRQCPDCGGECEENMHPEEMEQ